MTCMVCVVIVLVVFVVGAEEVAKLGEGTDVYD